MTGEELRRQVEAFVRADLQPFFDSLAERAALSDEEYWQRMEEGRKELPDLPDEIKAQLGRDFLSKEEVIPRRRERDLQMQAASETLVETKLNRCLPFVEVVHGGSDLPVTRAEYEQAALQAATAELEGIRGRLKLRADEAGDDYRGRVTKRLSDIAEIDIAAFTSLGDTRPMTEEALREVAEGICERLARLGEDIRTGRLKKPDKPEGQ